MIHYYSYYDSFVLNSQAPNYQGALINLNSGGPAKVLVFRGE
jgi:hypothetical protein